MAMPRPFITAACVDTQTGLGHALDPADNLLLTRQILQGHADGALLTVIHDGKALDVAFVNEDLRDGLLHVGCRDVNGSVLRGIRVPDAGEHIGNYI